MQKIPTFSAGRISHDPPAPYPFFRMYIRIIDFIYMLISSIGLLEALEPRAQRPNALTRSSLDSLLNRKIERATSKCG